MHLNSILNWFKYNLQPKIYHFSFLFLFYIVLKSVSCEDLSFSLGFGQQRQLPLPGEIHVKATRQLRNNREHAQFGKMLLQRWRTSWLH